MITWVVHIIYKSSSLLNRSLWLIVVIQVSVLRSAVSEIKWYLECPKEPIHKEMATRRPMAVAIMCTKIAMVSYFYRITDRTLSSGSEYATSGNHQHYSAPGGNDGKWECHASVFYIILGWHHNTNTGSYSSGQSYRDSNSRQSRANKWVDTPRGLTWIACSTNSYATLLPSAVEPS